MIGHGTVAVMHGARIAGLCALCRLVAAKSSVQKNALFWGSGILA
jgi:hypothetical protein